MCPRMSHPSVGIIGNGQETLLGQGKVLGAGKPFGGKENSWRKEKETLLDKGKILMEKGKPPRQ